MLVTNPGQLGDRVGPRYFSAGVDGRPEIAQLIGIRFTDVQIIGAWTGQARLELHPSVNCTLADLPVRGITRGLHMVTHMTLPYGELLHDYLA